jgi:hypothetical protein
MPSKLYHTIINGANAESIFEQVVGVKGRRESQYFGRQYFDLDGEFDIHGRVVVSSHPIYEGCKSIAAELVNKAGGWGLCSRYIKADFVAFHKYGFFIVLKKKDVYNLLKSKVKEWDVLKRTITHNPNNSLYKMCGTKNKRDYFTFFDIRDVKNYKEAIIIKY